MFVKVILEKKISSIAEFFFFDENKLSFVSLDAYDPKEHLILCLPKGHNSILLRVPDSIDSSSLCKNSSSISFIRDACLVSDAYTFLEITRFICNLSSRYDSPLNLAELRDQGFDSVQIIYEVYLSFFKCPDSEFFLKQQTIFADIIPRSKSFSQLFSYLVYIDKLYSILTKKNDALVEECIKTLVVIPTYGNLSYTCACLASIYIDLVVSLCNKGKAPLLDIVVNDDCYPEAGYQDDFLKLNRLNLVSAKINANNVGFLLNCNKTVAANINKWHKHIALLNNDVEVLPGWINGLLDTFSIFDNVGVVGSQQISFQGKIQDAGGLVWRDGSAWNYGKGSTPLSPEFDFARSVDYISGASVVILAHIWQELSGFDQRYVPAYYEDTDLCLAVQALGYKVIYQPVSRVLHVEGASCGSDIEDENSLKRFQAVNKTKFVHKWNSILKYKNENADNVDQSLHSQKIKSALVIEDLLLSPDEDAGSLYMMNNCLALQELGYSISYIPADNFCYMRDCCINMGLRGIEVLAHPRIKQIDDLRNVKGSIPFAYKRNWDIIVICRPCRIFSIKKLREFFPSSKIIYYTHDLHYSRLLSYAQNSARSDQKSKYERESQNMKQIEKDIFSQVDLVFHVSEEEQKEANQLCPHNSVYLNPVVDSPSSFEQSYKGGNDIVFVGSSSHPPNLEGIMWFLEKIWPDVSSEFQDSKLHIIGKSPSSSLVNLSSSFESVLLHGYVKSLQDVFGKCVIGIAPLLSGAGVKGKVLSYLSYGLGVVSTSYGAQGLPNIPVDVLSVADNSESFSEAIKAKLSVSPTSFKKNRCTANNYIQDYFSEESLIHKMKEGLDLLDCSYYKDVLSFAKYSSSELDVSYNQKNSLVYYRDNPF
ncbi:glycosyltransferase [Synechococcus sp. ROS8604]|uniref:glycosyltransferase n=1 Tax=Synechococcus sp. ROS8604 TaxID=1442557 RepID=UPI00164454EB|nr:glycosyltransferase [Synechococcus sp. ROS8604]QNI86897.1 glycosyl transferases group 1 family protein [Synechococcus sp. ROS8604]